MSFVHLENARVEEQLKIMQQIENDGVCPFCYENLLKYHKKPILKEGEYWLITTNQWPYTGTKHHFLAIARQHAETLAELPAEAGAELITLFQAISDEFSVAGGTIAMRMGSEKYASSVRHLHAHFIEPDFNSPEHKGIKFPVSKTDESTTEQK